MDRSRASLKTAFVPLALLWLAVHVALLGLILSLKFLAAKMLLVLAMAGTALWLVVKHKPRLPRLPGMV